MTTIEVIPIYRPPVHTSDGPPANPIDGQIWWDSDSGALFVWYAENDFSSAQWVEVGNGGGTNNAGVFVSDSPPTTDGLTQGRLWWNSATGNLYCWFEDVDSGQWVQVNTPPADGSTTLVTSTASAAIPTETHTLADWMQYVAPLHLDVRSSGRWGQDNGGGMFIYQDITSAAQAITGGFGAASRDQAKFNYTGGDPTKVYSTTRILTDVTTDVTDLVWGLSSTLTNAATAGQNVAGAFTAIKAAGAGPTWAALFNLQDNGTGVPTTGSPVVEIGHYSNGPDAAGNGSRVLLHMVYSKQAPGGADPEVSRGIHIEPQTPGIGSLKTAIKLDGAGVVGIDMLGSTYSSGVAVRMPNNTGFGWHTGDAYKLNVNSGALAYSVSGANMLTVSAGGNVGVTGILSAATGAATVAGGATNPGVRMGSTAAHGIYYGSGPPTISGTKGSLYMRSDGTGVNDRIYVNTNGGTTWTAIVTVA